MQSFCKTCGHRQYSKELREKFNREVRPIFTQCPIIEKNFAGCLVKTLDVDWKNFIKYLSEHQLLTKADVIKLKELGWKLEKGKVEDKP